MKASIRKILSVLLIIQLILNVGLVIPTSAVMTDGGTSVDVFSEMSFVDENIFTPNKYNVGANCLGGWGGASYVKSCILDFGAQTPYSVTINYAGASTNPAGISIWAIDNSVDSSGYYASFSNLYDNEGTDVSNLYRIVSIPSSSLTLDGFSNMHSITVSLSARVTGENRIFISTSNALDLYSIKFSPVDVFSEMSFTNTEFFTAVGYDIKPNGSIGGWHSGDYVKSCMLDFGKESPESVTINYSGAATLVPNIYVWAIDESVDSTGYYAKKGTLYDSTGHDVSKTYQVAVIPGESLTLDGFNNMHSITYTLSKGITGKSRIFVTISKAVNLYSITFSKEEIPVFELKVTADEFDSQTSTVNFTFNTDVDISSAEFVVSDVNQNKAYSKLEVIDSKTASFAFPYGLSCDGEYTVDFSGVIKTDDKSEYSGSFVFTAVATPIAVYNASFTDENRKPFENLDDVFILNFEYESKNTGNESVIVTQYADNKLSKCDVYKLEDDGLISTYILDNTDKVKYFIWNIASMSPKFATTVYSRSEEWKPQPRPLSITGGFYGNSGNAVYSIEGQTNITAKAKLNASGMPENLTAYLKLVRSGEEIFSDESEVSFNENGVAEVSVVYENTNATAGDVLVFEINDGQPDMTFKLYSPLTDDSISIAPVKDNKKAVYTFVSDDALYPSVSFFNEEFKRLGLRGTVAMVTDWIETPGTGQGWDYGTWDKWRELIGEGYFTIANHTRNHPSFSGQEKSVYQYQINSALEKLNEEFPGQKVLGFCAPGNYVNSDVTSVTKERHLSLRKGSHYNDLPATEESLYSVGFKTVNGTTTTLEEMNGWVDSAITENKWLMEMWHGVDGEGWAPPSKEMATAHFEYVADKKDDIWVADWNEMIIYSLQRLKSRITKVSETNDELVIEITDTLDDSMYDAELTVNVTLPESWSNALAKVNGIPKDVIVAGGVLCVTIPTGNSTITITRIN